MKRPSTFLALVFAVAAFLPIAGAAQRWEVLRAINWVENPTNHARFGPKGELGPYQFRASTWRAYTQLPFSYAARREHADAVAVEHYEWIKRGLMAAGIDPSPYNIALVWNCGLSAVTAGRVPRSTYRYAEQVHNLVEMLERQRAMAAAAERPAPAAAPEPAKPAHAPVIAIGDDAPAVVFSRQAPRSAPKFVIFDHVPEEEIPVVITDKTAPVPVAKPAPAVGEAPPFFVATALGTPRFYLLD